MQQEPFRTKKSLGQHFLRSQRVIQRILRALDLVSGDAILEIGCGTGALTSQLATKQFTYIGVELDPFLVNELQSNYSNASFLGENILNVDLVALCRHRLGKQQRFKIVGNLPYYLSSPILQHLTRNVAAFDMAVVMVQAEVADRLVATPGTKAYGVLTLQTQYYFKAHDLFTVPPSAFKPAPKVFSKVVRLVPWQSRPLGCEDEGQFFEFVKQSFSQRRKTLKNCLKSFLPSSLPRLSSQLEALGYPQDVRAEAISLLHFIQLFVRLNHRDSQ